MVAHTCGQLSHAMHSWKCTGKFSGQDTVRNGSQHTKLHMILLCC